MDTSSKGGYKPSEINRLYQFPYVPNVSTRLPTSRTNRYWEDIWGMPAFGPGQPLPNPPPPFTQEAPSLLIDGKWIQQANAWLAFYDPEWAFFAGPNSVTFGERATAGFELYGKYVMVGLLTFGLLLLL